MLLLLATPIYAQSNDAFTFSPKSGSPAGGDVIEFTTTTLDWRCCGTPQVLFGGVASPQATVVSATVMRAVTPAHVEDVVNVEVRLGTQSYKSFFLFGYVRPREELMIPVALDIPGAHGSRCPHYVSVRQQDAGRRPWRAATADRSAAQSR